MAEYARALELQETIEAAQSGGAPGEVASARDRLAEVARRLHACLVELAEVGVELKDYTAGVVDFPCLAGGREVRLCWRFGEEQVRYWHEPGDCSGARRPIETLPVEDAVEVGG
jgi:hypothetical protein